MNTCDQLDKGLLQVVYRCVVGESLNVTPSNVIRFVCQISVNDRKCSDKPIPEFKLFFNRCNGY